MAITSDQAVAQYTASSTGGGQSFPIPFYFLAAADLVVIRTTAGVDTTLALNTDYAVSGAGTNPSTAAINGLTCTTGDVITIARDDDELQGTKYISNGAFPASTTETAFDKLVMLVQKLAWKVARAPRLPVSAGTQAEFPLPARAGQVLAFDANGNFVATSPLQVATGAVAAAVASSVGTLRLLSASAWSTGSPIYLSGYYAPGDGGDGWFTWNAASTATDDGGSVIALTGVATGRLIRVINGPLNVRWWGAKGIGTGDDSPAIQAAVAYAQAQGGGHVFLPAGTYYCTSTQLWVTAGGVTIRGAGIGASVIKIGAYLDGIRVANGYPGPAGIISDVTIQDLSINMNVGAYSSPNDTASNGINLNSVQNFVVQRVHVYNCPQQGIVATWESLPSIMAQGNVSDCIVDMAAAVTQDGIGFEGGFSRVIASGNRVAYTTNPGAGIYAGNASTAALDNANVAITGNVVVAPSLATGYGIQLEGSWHNAAIVGNTVDGFGNGIRADNGLGSGTAAILAVTGNVVRNWGAAGYGILTIPDGAVDRQTTIVGNVFTSANAVNGGAIIGKNTHFSGNRVNVPNGASNGVVASNGAVVSGNLITSGSYAVDISADTSGTCFISGNYMTSGVNGQFNGTVVNNYSTSGWGTRVYNRMLDTNGLRIFASNAAPSTGTWAEGDICLNVSTGAHVNFGWQCTAAGTPGTWAALPANGLQQCADQAASSGWADSTAMTDFNNLLAKLKSAGLMG